VAPTTCKAEWKQLGNDIDGEAAGDYSGWSVSMSDDGSRVAIGAVWNDGNGTDSGHTRIYDYDTTSKDWKQLGNDIDGEAAGDYSGWSVSMSNDGSRVAIGAIYNAGTGSNSGHTRIYDYDTTSDNWIQLGNDIDGEAAGYESGYAVSMSDDGSRVAIGARFNGGNGIWSGQTRIYEYDTASQDWRQLGNDINGEAAFDQSGFAVSISDDGSRVAIGARFNGGNGDRSGHTRIYEYDTGSKDWSQLGSDIDGEAAGDYSGWSVSMSNDGSRVAIGAFYNAGTGSNSGHTRIYDYDTTSNNWIQLGNDIDGEAAHDSSGSAVSMSDDGSRVAIGARYNDGNGSDSGHTRIYEYDTASKDWRQLGNDIDGEAADDSSGQSVSMSDDGSRVAIGAPWNDGNGDRSGHTRIYEYHEC